MKKRSWVSSGVVEELDLRQQRLLEEVFAQVQSYYRELYLTEKSYSRPLTLSQLARMCNKSKLVVMGAVRMLANTVESGRSSPCIFYERLKSGRNASHRPYQIFLREGFA